MGGTSGDVKGPDLREGVPASMVLEGELFTGHVDGKPVLLARVDGEVNAIGAKCSHYGGPLGDGLLDGDRVHCPWHHACFSVRTGEALQAPALRDVDAWTVEEKDGVVRITGKRAREPKRQAPPKSPASIVIVGAGAAGEAAAEKLRREGYPGPVRMIDSEASSPYDRPNLSKDYLAGTAPEEWIPLREPAFFRDQDIEIVRASVSRIEPDAHRIHLADGDTVEYGALLLAPGAEPVRLPSSVDPGGRAMYLRSFADSRAIIDAAEGSSRAVVIGASFIGLEVAASLRQRGVRVAIVAPEQVPLERVMGRALGEAIHRVHAKHGVDFHLGRTVGRISPDGLELDDGTNLAADLVVAGIGVRPRTALASDAGIDVDDGIQVDDRLRTSKADVFAAGDVARVPDARTGRRIRVEHWVFAQRMGQAAARSMLGHDERFVAAPFFWSQHYDAVIAYVGHAADWDASRLDGDPEEMDCAVRLEQDGQLMALATIFRDIDSLRAEVAMEERARHTEEPTGR